VSRDVIGVVRKIPQGDLKKQFGRELPAFYFFDPAAKLVKKTTGKASHSLSSFSSHLEKTWVKSYTMKIKDFRKQKIDILTRPGSGSRAASLRRRRRESRQECGELRRVSDESCGSAQSTQGSTTRFRNRLLCTECHPGC